MTKIKLNRKKIIAREFLILIGSIGICILTFVSTYPYNYFNNLRISEIRDSIKLVKAEVDRLERPFYKKVNKQQWFFNKHLPKYDLNSSSYPTYTELWRELSELQSKDSLIYAWNNNLKSDYKEFLKGIGFKGPKEFNQFVYEYTLRDSELLNKSKAAEIEKVVNELQQSVQNKQKNILDLNRQLRFANLLLVSILIIAFPLRYLIYSIIWSIKTLKQKE